MTISLISDRTTANGLPLLCHPPRGQSLEALSVNQYKLSYDKNLVIVFVIRKKSGDCFVYKSSIIPKLQKFSETDIRGIFYADKNN